jgi:protein-disulfide isomerase
MRGNAAAVVSIVEFGDFQCPYCRAVQPVLEQLLQKYAGRVSISFRDLPLRQIHPQAQQAAEAARCVGDQGKFWEYHDALYASQAKLGAADLLDQARAIGADTGQFQECLNSGKFRTQIQKDVEAAALAGVNATPMFFINGIQFSGAQPLSAFESVIGPELARVEANTR